MHPAAGVRHCRLETVIDESTPLLARCSSRSTRGTALVYKGNVGTGFDADTMADLAKKFTARERKTAPLDVERDAARKVRWLKPELVAEIAFAEFTASGSVRHASFLGLRADKEAKT